MDRFGRTAFLSEAARPTTQHYKILVMAWAGWLFDFYDLLLYSFLRTYAARSARRSDSRTSSCRTFWAPPWPPLPSAGCSSAGSQIDRAERLSSPGPS
jgi:hypothetical protein